MASYNDIQDLNQRSIPKKGASAPQLKRITHEASANGGHVFTHGFHSPNGSYKEPEVHTFGPDEHKEAAEHFNKHAGLKVRVSLNPEDSEDPEETGEESAAGAAY